MQGATLVDATDLKTWADRRDAQSLLPQIVCRLVAGNQSSDDHRTCPRRAG